MIFGIGTGRCGTKSLCGFLNSQKKIISGHESYLLPWKPNLFYLMQLLSIMKNEPYKYVVECASYILPYAIEILKENPTTKFICLKRNKDAVVESFIKKSGLRNHWVNDEIRERRNFEKDKKWDKCFPSYYIDSKYKAIEKYFDEYYQTVNQLIDKYPNNFAVFNINNLNTKEGKKSILEFIEYKYEFNLDGNFQYNKGLDNTPKRYFCKK